MCAAITSLPELTALRVFPQVRSGQAARLDWLGFVLTAGCLSALVVMASDLGPTAVSWWLVAASGSAGIALGVAAVGHLHRRDQPLLDLDVLRIRTFRISHYSGSTFRATVFAVPFVLALSASCRSA